MSGRAARARSAGEAYRLPHELLDGSDQRAGHPTPTVSRGRKVLTREQMIDEAVQRAMNVHDRRDLFLGGGDGDFLETYAIHRIADE